MKNPQMLRPTRQEFYREVFQRVFAELRLRFGLNISRKEARDSARIQARRMWSEGHGRSITK